MHAHNAEDLTALPAHRLADLIATGDAGAREVVDAHIARIEAVNPALNAVVETRYEAARAEADAVDAARQRGDVLAPLAGVPVTVKECLDLDGMRTTNGLVSWRDRRATADEVHVARLRAAGAIVLGKTNVAQMLAFFETDNPVYGRTNNPWDLARSPGGSSGGEAAVIAAGGSALGLGTDIGGSCRNPAAFSGICGFKPSAGRLPDTGTGSFSLDGPIASEVGVLARTAEDVARTVAVVNGAMPLGDPATVDLAGLRIAVVATDGLLDAGAAAQRAVADAADALRSAGVKAEAWALPSPQMGLGLTLHALGIDRLQHLVDVAAGTPLDPRVKQIVKLTTMGPGLRKVMHAVLDRMGQHSLAAGLMALAVDPSPAGRAATVAGVDAYRERFAAALAADGFDAVLLPASPLPAIPHGATKTLATLGSYTMLWNILGYPAGVVPWTAVRADDAVRPKARDIVVKAARKAEEGAAGLPIGVQVVARHGEDHVALALMQALETASVRLGEHPGSPAI